MGGDKKVSEDTTADSKASPLGETSLQEKKLLATNQQSGAQGVIDSISTRASYEDGAPETVIINESDSAGGSEETSSKGSTPIVVESGGGDDAYEGLYKGS